MSTNSDIEQVRRIAERAMLSDIDDFSTIDGGSIFNKTRAQASTYGGSERVRAYTKD